MGASTPLTSAFPDDSGASVTIHGDVVGILDELKLSLIVSASPSRIFCIGAEDGKLTANVIPFQNPFGVSVVDGRLALSSRHTIVTFTNAAHMAASYPCAPGRYDGFFAPRTVFVTGNCRTHDLQVTENGPVFANTQFSCVSVCDGVHSFTPLWKPSFISELMPEDRCHLNGFAFSGGRPVIASFFAPCDSPAGYRQLPINSGQLVDMESGAVAVAGLTLPHSPRLFEDGLFVCNSGMGDVLKIDLANGKAEVVARLPGFTRGMRAQGDFLFVGLSAIRATRREIPLLERGTRLLTGLAVIERRSGKVRGVLELPDTVSEVMDFDLVPGYRRLFIQDPSGDDGQCAIGTPANGFWMPLTERARQPTAEKDLQDDPPLDRVNR